MALPLKLGSRDPQPAAPSVRELQNKLIAKGFSCGPYGADGVFGSGTERAVRNYQTRLGLEVDGIVGTKTWAKLTYNGHVSTASKMADLALRLVTQGIDGSRPEYKYGAEVNLTNPSPDKIDCSELVQWAVYQITGRDWVDGSRFQYANGIRIPVHTAINNKGTLLFIAGDSDAPSTIHHVAISMGDGTTAEARNRKAGCGSWPTSDRGWTHAARIPILSY